MEFMGIIKHIAPVETYTGRDGQNFCSRNIVVTTEESHPQTAVFTLRHNIAADFNAHIGQHATVHFDCLAFKGKQTDTAPQEVYFNKLSAWKVELN